MWLQLTRAVAGGGGAQLGKRFLDTARPAQRAGEVDLWVEKWPNVIDVAALPCPEVGSRDFSGCCDCCLFHGQPLLCRCPAGLFITE